MDEESLDEEPLLNGNQAARNIINRYFTFVNESSICNFPLWKLFLYSVTHVFWVLLISLPSIIIIGLISYGYSSIQWTRPCPNTPRNVSHGHTCDYYVKEAIVYGDVIVRMVLLAVIPVLVSGVSVVGKSKFLKHLLCISLPLIILTFACLPGFLKYDRFWFYFIDVALFEAVFIISYTATLVMVSKEVNEFRFWDLFSSCVFPGVIAALGIGFVDVYLNRTYQSYENGSIQQYFIRLVAFPVIMDAFIGFGELRIRKIPRNDYNQRAHMIYFYQVAFSIIGRYMTTTSGTLSQIAFMSAAIAVKDVFVHRISRLQCWIAYKFKAIFCKCKFCSPDGQHESFKEWFFSEDFCNFRANVLHNELVNELIGAFIVPITVVAFENHKLLYNFHYESFFNAEHQIDNNYFLQQEAIQLFFLLTTFIVVTMIEGKYNGVDLRIVYKKVDWVQHVSQILIYLWGMLLLLSSIRVIPNVFQCFDNDICTCTAQFNKALYNC